MILRMLLLLCIFCAGWQRMRGALWREQRLAASLPPDEAQIEAEGTVTWIEEKENWDVITLRTKEWESILIYGETGEGQSLRIGRQIGVWGQVSRFAEPGNPGQFDFARYYRTRGVSMMVFAEEIRQMDEGYWPLQDGLSRLRMSFSRTLEAVCLPDDPGIFQAAILGEKGRLREEIRDLYQKSGIAHLLAISGLHLSLIGGGFYRLLRKAGAGFGAAGAAGAALVAAYGIMTGASGSAVRAIIMLTASFLAAWLGRTYDLLSALSLAALLIAGENPLIIGESGFQLSFGAVLGIGFSGEILKPMMKPRGRLGETILTSVGIQLITIPIVLWHYFQYPVYGILLNFLVIPLMGHVLISGILGMTAGLVSLSLGRLAVGAGHYILLLYQGLALLALELPWSLVIAGRPGPGQIALYGAGLWILLAGIRYGGRILKEKGKWGILLGGSILCFLLLPAPPQKGMELCFLDVGQGDGAVIRAEGDNLTFQGLSRKEAQNGQIRETAASGDKALSGKGIVILSDCGSITDRQVGENRLEPYLKSCGIGAVDVILVSHGDSDHLNGISYLLEECREIRAGHLVLPEAGREDSALEELILAAEARSMTVWYMDGGDRICAGDLTLTCLYPGKGEERGNPDRNMQSLVIKGDYPGFHFLLTGDTGAEGEQRVAERIPAEELARIQVLKAAHHGSRYSSSTGFLRAVSPAVTVLSCGKDNPYGHPHEETRERLRNVGSRILETEKTGAITFYAEKGKVRYRTYKPVYMENPP